MEHLLEVEDRPIEGECCVAQDASQYLPLSFLACRHRLLEQGYEGCAHMFPVSTQSPLCSFYGVVAHVCKCNSIFFRCVLGRQGGHALQKPVWLSDSCADPLSAPNSSSSSESEEDTSGTLFF
eukprot:CAMPEP_0172211042 /NCGR_PEP_ID=MMETSP1050-20130122/36167_1 /TAXON_ID=233186 /ORGANISM="Cryptomonas curvata, Strain CCAP979/52" /LENGTH=122 /DNA_ID=CAMNT_0012891419 /DNA_START=129 /DNA_END=494 /DNA_ORIENTATION=-